MMYVITKRKDRRCRECVFYKEYRTRLGTIGVGCMARTPKEENESPKPCPLA